MTQRYVLIVTLLLGVLIGAGSTRFIYDNGLFSILDFREFVGGLFNEKSVREYDFAARAKLNKSKAWADVVAKREFQKLTEKEKEQAREQYYREVIAPTLPPLGIADAENAFQTYAALAEDSARRYGFFADPLPLPETGTERRYSPVEYIAPLEIRTRSQGYHYYLKISDFKTNIAVQTVFVRGGDTVQVNVPIGRFSLKYATGRTWYGEEHLFGPETSRSKAEKVFEFRASDGDVSGYTVELFRQAGGNLPTSGIAADEW